VFHLFPRKKKLLVLFAKWRSVLVALLEYYIDCICCQFFAVTVHRYRLLGPASNTLLTTVTNSGIAAKNFMQKVAFSAQGRGSDFGASVMKAVGPVNLGPTLIVCMHEFMYHGMLECFFLEHPVLAHDDLGLVSNLPGWVVNRKAPANTWGTRSANQKVGRNLTSKSFQSVN